MSQPLSRVLAAAAFAVSLGAPAVAQSSTGPVGLSATTPHLRYHAVPFCAEGWCTPAMPGTGLPCAGGAAYDTRTRGIWATNGVVIAKFDTTGLSCPAQCAPVPLPGSSATVWGTGLAYQHDLDRLWVTYSNNTIRVLQVSGCALVQVSQCGASLPVGFTLTGIAYDDITSSIYYSWTTCSGPQIGGWVSRAPATTCVPTCVVQIGQCSSGATLQPLTGVAFDACRNEVWVTDGTRTGSFTAPVATGCQVQLRECCPTSIFPNDRFVGLCFRPSQETVTGGPCSAAVCPPCVPVHRFANGDPVIGNTGFTLDGDTLPAGATAATFLSFGACTPPGVVIPPFCGPVLVNVPGLIGAFSLPTGGGVGCTGSTSLAVSIPLVTAMCGTTLSSQILGACFAAGVGTFATPCLSWTITSS